MRATIPTSAGTWAVSIGPVPLVVAGRRFAALLDVDARTLTFNADAPLRDLVEAAIQAGCEIERIAAAERAGGR